MNAQEHGIGASVTRTEDTPFLTGNAQYVTNLDTPPTTGYLFLLRSEYAHATINSIDTSAVDSSGVLGVFTADDVLETTSPNRIQVTFPDATPGVSGHPLLAESRVRYHGQPVVAVVAESPEEAQDAAQRIDIDYTRHEAVPELNDAHQSDAPTVHNAAPDNIAFDWDVGDNNQTLEAINAATHTLELSLTNNKLLPSAIEPRAALAQYDASRDHVTVEMTSLASAAGMERAQTNGILVVPAVEVGETVVQSALTKKELAALIDGEYDGEDSRP